jgi:small multidrug resistance family-3 protein
MVAHSATLCHISLLHTRSVAFTLSFSAELVLYGVVAALQPVAEFGRVYAAYGGIFVMMAIVRAVPVNGFRPDRYDLAGATVVLSGVILMVAPPR